MMTIHEHAVKARKQIENAWFNKKFKTKRYQLYAKCRGLIVGDQIENAVFHNDWRHAERGE